MVIFTAFFPAYNCITYLRWFWYVFAPYYGISGAKKKHVIAPLQTGTTFEGTWKLETQVSTRFYCIANGNSTNVYLCAIKKLDKNVEIALLSESFRRAANFPIKRLFTDGLFQFELDKKHDSALVDKVDWLKAMKDKEIKHRTRLVVATNNTVKTIKQRLWLKKRVSTIGGKPCRLPLSVSTTRNEKCNELGLLWTQWIAHHLLRALGFHGKMNSCRFTE